MKNRKLFVSISLATLFSLTILFTVLKVEAIQDFFDFGYEPDLPSIVQKSKSKIDKKEYMRLRDEQIAFYRGMIDGDPIKNIKKRNDAVGETGRTVAFVVGFLFKPSFISRLDANWSESDTEWSDSRAAGHLGIRSDNCDCSSSDESEYCLCRNGARRTLSFA
jgi:hypothetical protein